MRSGSEAAHGQASYDVRLDWGATGGAAVAGGADVAVVVDVLSFTTTLAIAVSRGTRVHPFPWKDERAAAFAADRTRCWRSDGSRRPGSSIRPRACRRHSC